MFLLKKGANIAIIENDMSRVILFFLLSNNSIIFFKNINLSQWNFIGENDEAKCKASAGAETILYCRWSIISNS